MSVPSRKARVFIVEPNPRFNTSDTTKWGEITYLSPVSVNPLDVQKTFEWLDERLAATNFDPSHDHIAISGSLLMVTLALTACALRFGTLSLLVFDARSGAYIQRKLSRPAETKNASNS